MSRKAITAILVLGAILYCLTLLGIVFDKISFGSGLGDLGFLIMFGIFEASILIFYFSIMKLDERQNVGATDNILACIVIIAHVYLLLSMTFWRGSEHLWDGHIFN